ncbi:hypothetical protein E4U25_003831 [Claviceps purpurea]|nr:hypothetical protein E4U25_003831 [Claviceps purpurea]
MTTYSTDPALYIFTSLTAGSSHIVTATSRLETILRANRVPFKAVDIAVDDKARMLWGRRAGKDDAGRLRKLPGLVQEGLVIGDLVEIEDWNEYGELKQHVKIYYDEHTIPNIHNKPPEPKKTQKPAAKPAVSKNTPVATSKTAPAAPPAPSLPKAKAKPSSSSSTPTTTKTGTKTPDAESQTTLPMRSVADEAAQKAKEIRLKSLREKVHGKKADSNAGAEPPASKATTSNTDTAQIKETTITEKSTPAGLQSPTSSTWQNKDAGSLIPQSPTSGKWRPGSIIGAMNHDGAVDEGVNKGEPRGEKESDQAKVSLKDVKAEDDNKGSKEAVKDQRNDEDEKKEEAKKEEKVKEAEVKEEKVKEENVKEAEVKEAEVKEEKVKEVKEEVKEGEKKKEEEKKEEAKDGAVDGSKEKTTVPPSETAESKKDDEATGEDQTEDTKTQ